MAIREMEMGGMGKLGMATRRDAEGGLDFDANIRELVRVGASVDDVMKAFGKRAGPAILGLMKRIGHLETGLGDFGGTALDNALEHLNTWETTLAKYAAAQGVATNSMGEGVIAVRKLGLQIGTTLIQGLNALGPGVAKARAVPARWSACLVALLLACSICRLAARLQAARRIQGHRERRDRFVARHTRRISRHVQVYRPCHHRRPVAVLPTCSRPSRAACSAARYLLAGSPGGKATGQRFRPLLVALPVERLPVLAVVALRACLVVRWGLQRQPARRWPAGSSRRWLWAWRHHIALGARKA